MTEVYTVYNNVSTNERKINSGVRKKIFTGARDELQNSENRNNNQEVISIIEVRDNENRN